MKLTFFCDKIPLYGKYKGGVSAYSLNLLRSMSQKNNVSVINSIVPKVYSLDENTKLALNHWPTLDLKFVKSYGGPMIRSLFALKKFEQLVDSQNLTTVDLINTDIKLFVPFSKRNPKLKKVNILKHIYMNPFKNSLVHSFIQKKIYDLIDGFIVTSHLIEEYLIKFGVPEELIDYAPPQIDCNLYTPINNSEKKIKTSKCNFLYIGSLTSEKVPIKTIIEVCKSLKSNRHEYSLKLHGWGTQKEKAIVSSIKELINKNSLQDFITVTSTILSIPEKIKLFNDADVVILLYSGFLAVDPPITMLEVMSCGKIFIGSNVQSIRSIISDGYNGLLVEDLEYQTLYNKFIHAMEIYKNSKIKKRARNLILKEYSYDVVSKQLLTIYKRYEK